MGKELTKDKITEMTYTKEEADTRKLVERCFEEIKKVQEHVVNIQNLCDHRITDIQWYSWRPGAQHPTKICEVCLKPLGDPETKEEKEKASKMYTSLFEGLEVTTNGA